MWIGITWSNVVFWRWRKLCTTGEFKSNLQNSNNQLFRYLKLLVVIWLNKKMIYRLIFISDPVTLSQLRKKKLCCVSVIRKIQKDAICKLRVKTIIDLKWFIFLVLTEISLKLLHRQHVIMILLFDWPITVSHQWPPDLDTILNASLKQKCTVSKPIDGTTLMIILLAREYMI